MINKDISIRELQKHIKEIDFKPEFKLQVMLKLVEEVGELAVEVRRESMGTLSPELKDKIKYELYDILHFVNHMANIYDIDLVEAIVEKDKINAIKYKRKEGKK
jgi:NTP pyrophosphatase (non-canonical NTP hydrolase)